jgi:hypothetical protein
MQFKFDAIAEDYIATGGAGLYFAGGRGYSDEMTVLRLPDHGTCGDHVCDAPHENCVNCAFDCAAPCGCSDGICASDDEAKGCLQDWYVLLLLLLLCLLV